MSWDIVAGIITITGAVIAIGKIIYNNTVAMTRLSCSVDNLTEKMNRQTEKIDRLTERVEKLERSNKA